MSEFDAEKLSEYAELLENHKWIRDRITEEKYNWVYEVQSNNLDRIKDYFSIVVNGRYLFPEYFYLNKILNNFLLDFQNNPYYYASGYMEKGLYKNVYSCYPECYLIEINDDFFSFGFLYEKFEKDCFKDEIETYLKLCKTEYLRNIYFPILKLLDKEKIIQQNIMEIKVTRKHLLSLVLNYGILLIAVCILYVVKILLFPVIQCNFRIFYWLLLFFMVFSAIRIKKILDKCMELGKVCKSYIKFKNTIKIYYNIVDYIRKDEIKNCFLENGGKRKIIRFSLKNTDYDFLYEFYNNVDEIIKGIELKQFYESGWFQLLGAVIGIILVCILF